MIRLTDEELAEATNTHYEGQLLIDCVDCGMDVETIRAVAKAQLKKVVEWGKEYCVWHPQQLPNGSLYANLHRRQCDVCWQTLLEEVEEIE